MAFSIFTDKADEPAPDELADVLGRKLALWEELRRRMADQYAPLTAEWVYSGKNYGWSLRLKQKKRAVVYLTPSRGYFRASFALGEKAALAARDAGLPEIVLAIIDSAPKYVEGRAVRLEVRSRRDVDAVERIAAVKMST